MTVDHIGPALNSGDGEVAAHRDVIDEPTDLLLSGRGDGDLSEALGERVGDPGPTTT